MAEEGDSSLVLDYVLHEYLPLAYKGDAAMGLDNYLRFWDAYHVDYSFQVAAFLSGGRRGDANFCRFLTASVAHLGISERRAYAADCLFKGASPLGETATMKHALFNALSQRAEALGPNGDALSLLKCRYLRQLSGCL